jgi:hypothetical protein
MKKVILFIALILLPIPANAQTPQIDCSQFRHNDDGSWSPLVPVRITGPNGSVQIGPGVSFREGVAFMGIDLAALLDQQCR